MSEAGEHLELLKNAVRQPIAALTAVETDTVYQAKELAKMLAADIGERPNETLSMAVEDGASSLLYQARRISENWADDQGVLFVIDDGGKDADKRYPFWVEMNALRESWAALNCHVIFFLLPQNYRMLLQVADHLADWMPVKLYIFSEIEDEFDRKDDYFLHNIALSSKKVAHQQLSMLERQLIKALRQGIEERSLIQSYYLPMFVSAIQLNELHRAKSLRQRITDNYISCSDKSLWLYMNWRLDFLLRRFNDSVLWGERLINCAKKVDNKELELAALYSLTKTEIERNNFELAQKWYDKYIEANKKKGIIIYNTNYVNRKKYQFELHRILTHASPDVLKLLDEHGKNFIQIPKLDIDIQKEKDFNNIEKYYYYKIEACKKNDDEHGIGVNYLELGRITQEQNKNEDAEKWYKQALSIWNKLGDENLLAMTKNHLGILARQQGRLESSGEWLIKSIKAFENTNDPENAAKAKEEFQKTYAQASPDVQAKLKEMWESVGLSEP